MRRLLFQDVLAAVEIRIRYSGETIRVHRKVESSDLGTSISVESHRAFLAGLDGVARTKPDLTSDEVPDRSSYSSVGERNSIVLIDNMNQDNVPSACEESVSNRIDSSDPEMSPDDDARVVKTTTGEDEGDEMGAVIFKASQILLHMSLQQGEPKASEEPPRHSSDTFEAMTLMLPECKDYESPSPGGVLHDPPLQPCRNTPNTRRLRRGRWLPDFRRDILPGLVSLSRHEIREDLQNLRHTGDAARDKGRSWFVPVGGRRSQRATAARS